MITALQKFKQAPTTVLETKFNIFSPFSKVERKQLNTTVYEDINYKVELKGFLLNQIHRDIIDIASYFGDSSYDKSTKDIRPIRIFSLYDIQKHLNYKSKNQNNWIDNKFSEIQQSVIKITDKNESDWIQFNIIEVAKYSKKLNSYAMIISELYMLFFENEISINYKNYLHDILKLNPQTKALARFILSHSNSFIIHLDKALKKIGICKQNMSIQAYRANRRKVLQDDDKLMSLNIQLIKNSDYSIKNQSYSISYKLLSKIKIYHPT